MPNYKRYFYNEDSLVFITVVTNERTPFLVENIDLLRESFKTSKYNFEIYAAVILPEHFHVILKPQYIEQIPKIISSIKYYFSKKIEYKKENKRESELKRKEKGVWQRRYYDHIIRNQEDLNKHLDYIHYNPVKHNLVNAVKDWKYSSFNKFVKLGLYEIDWCNFNDKNKIKDLELE